MFVAQVIAGGPARGQVRVATSAAKRNWWLPVPGAQVPAPAGARVHLKVAVCGARNALVLFCLIQPASVGLAVDAICLLIGCPNREPTSEEVGHPPTIACRSASAGHLARHYPIRESNVV